MLDDAPPSSSGDVNGGNNLATSAATPPSSSSLPTPKPLPPAINALTPEDHVAHMRRAIALSRAAGLEERTGGCFGAVVVCSKTKKVLGEGQNRVLETRDPTAHGEIMCLRDACNRLGSPHLPRGTAVMYTSAEPCPMCHGACLWARCSYVFYAARYEDVMELGRFEDVDFAAEIARRVEEKKTREKKEGEGEGGEEAVVTTTKATKPPPPLLEIAPLLREEALVVWREYASRTDNEHY